MTRRFGLAVAVLGLVIGAAGQVEAGLVFQNGTGVYSGNNPFSYQNVFVAQDFGLSQDTTLDGLIFNAHTTSNTLPITGVHVRIYEKTGTSGVGSTLYGGVFGVASETITGTNGGYILKDFRVDLGSWDLQSGEYWLALQVDPAQGAMHWTIPTSGTYGDRGLIGNSNGDASSYSSYSFEHSFKLTGTEGISAVPEPSTLAGGILGTLLAGGVWLRRRRQNA
jgi:hypothetical protein